MSEKREGQRPPAVFGYTVWVPQEGRFVNSVGPSSRVGTQELAEAEAGAWREDGYAAEVVPLVVSPRFTWADVGLLRGLADATQASGLRSAGAAFHNLADRIAALLPPREEP